MVHVHAEHGEVAVGPHRGGNDEVALGGVGGTGGEQLSQGEHVGHLGLAVLHLGDDGGAGRGIDDGAFHKRARVGGAAIAFPVA